MATEHMNAQPLRAVVYARVSTDAQERDGTSLDTQERACRSYAEASGWWILESIKDTASGFTLDRPGIGMLRLLLKQGSANVIVAYAVDRLSRNQNHIGVLFDEAQQAGVRLEFVTEKFEDTAIGRFILAARAFIAEVEREKIAERTMRGKAERARSGRIPQGTGPGFFGYRYDAVSGRREIDLAQALVVQQVFQRYAETRSLSAVSQELNKTGVPSFSGGVWYPIKVYRLLKNEAYTGRLIYRCTQRVVLRGENGSKRRNRVVVRPAQEWIEVQGATPRIVDQVLWERVQGILNDPERTKQRHTKANYLLRGRAKCGICGSAMVGQTLSVKKHPYRYYRCRHIYDNNSVRHCSGRYVPGDHLEGVVFQEIRRVLTDPTVVLAEWKRQTNATTDPNEIATLRKELEALTGREQRLVKLYGLGSIAEETIRAELEEVDRQRSLLTVNLHETQMAVQPDLINIDAESLKDICHRIGEWLDGANQAQRSLALEALQVNIKATRESSMISGVLPIAAPILITDDQSCRCSYSGEYAQRVPFQCPFYFARLECG